MKAIWPVENTLARESTLTKEGYLVKESTLAKEGYLAKESTLAKECYLVKESTLAKEGYLAQESILAQKGNMGMNSSLAEDSTSVKVSLAMEITLSPDLVPSHTARRSFLAVCNKFGPFHRASYHSF